MNTVVVVDDDKDFLDLVSLSLKRQNIRVLKANTARECLEFISSQAVQMIVTDISMPEINGLQLAKMIRAEKGYRTVPIILLTSAQSPITFQDTDFRVNAFCLKNKLYDQLLPQVSNLLEMTQSAE